MKVLVLGITGMLGSTMFRVLSRREGWSVVGSSRGDTAPRADRMLTGYDLADPEAVAQLFDAVRPDVVVNCAAITSYRLAGEDAARAMTINALLPQVLAEMCGATGARLIHFSTDCVFTGRKGQYVETDEPDAHDIYGKTKRLGEVSDSHTVTLRTSMIGHENGTRRGLLEWFLSQNGECKGYRRAIFSGLPTAELARVVRDIVIPNSELSGVYHVGAEAIDKHSLLGLIAKEYGKDTIIVPDDSVVVDRSLNSDRFAAATGYRAAAWPALIAQMREAATIR